VSLKVTLPVKGPADADDATFAVRAMLCPRLGVALLVVRPSVVAGFAETVRTVTAVLAVKAGLTAVAPAYVVVMEVVGAASRLVVMDAVPSVGSSVAEPRDAPPVIEK